MTEQELNGCTLTLSILDGEGNEVAKAEVPYTEVANFRKQNGAPIGALLENMHTNVLNIALYGHGGQGGSEHLPPRKPGGMDFNR